MVQLVVALDSIGSRVVLFCCCSGLSLCSLNREGSLLPANVMICARNEEGVVMFGDDLILHNLCIPLIAMSQEGSDVIFGSYGVPVDIWVSTKNTQLVLATTARN